MSEIQFDEATHVYTVGGVVVPGVTSILGDLSVMKRMDPALLAAARERGQMVHKAVHFYNQSDLDEDSVDDYIEPYLRAWKRFVADHKFEWLVGEVPLYSERWGFAGTPDCLGRWKRGRKTRRLLVDAKSGLPDPCHGPQTAAYVQLAHENDLLDRQEISDRIVVRLQPNGFYQVDEFPDQADWSTFVAALTCYRFKERHGLL